MTPEAQVTEGKFSKYDHIEQQPPGASSGEPGEYDGDHGAPASLAVNVVNKGGSSGHGSLCACGDSHLPAVLCGPSYQHVKHAHPEATRPIPVMPKVILSPFIHNIGKKQNILTYFIPIPSFLCLNICDMFFQTWKHKIIFLAENKHSLVQCTQGNAV